jgi:hypothetical protein
VQVRARGRVIHPWQTTTGQQLPNRIVPLRGSPLSHAFGAVPVRLDPGATARGTPVRWSTALACREGIFGRKTLSLEQAACGASAPKATVARSRWPVAKRRPAKRAGAVHAPAGWAAQSSTGGRGSNGHRGVATVRRCDLSSPKPAQCSRQFHACLRPRAISFEPKSCRSLVRNSCRTRGGLAVFGCN